MASKDTQTKEQKPGYYDSAKQYYNRQYDSWMPWVEDKYLAWFTKDNKASYATKDSLGKTKITGNEQVDNLQDGVNNLVGSQVGKGGIAQPIGDLASKEGVNRAERGGKDDKGGYLPGGMDKKMGDGAKGVSDGVTSGVKGAGGYLGFGGKGEEKK